MSTTFSEGKCYPYLIELVERLGREAAVALKDLLVTL